MAASFVLRAAPSVCIELLYLCEFTNKEFIIIRIITIIVIKN